MDMVVNIANEGMQTVPFGGLTFRESSPVEVGVAYGPECPDGVPKVLDNLCSPGWAIVILWVELFGLGVSILNPCPFGGAAAIEEVAPANGSLGGNEKGFVVREGSAGEVAMTV